MTGRGGDGVAAGPTGRSGDGRATKRSIALVIRHDRRPSMWLLVRRPPDDEDLPGVWGLPAGSHAIGEDDEALVERIGRDKLGVELVPVGEVGAGLAPRPAYDLAMTLFEARIAKGNPSVPQPVPGVTQYDALDWREPEALEPGARAGSLCCRLGLEAAGR